MIKGALPHAIYARFFLNCVSSLMNLLCHHARFISQHNHLENERKSSKMTEEKVCCKKAFKCDELWVKTVLCFAAFVVVVVVVILGFNREVCEGPEMKRDDLTMEDLLFVVRLN